jgi:hypothetical protein
MDMKKNYLKPELEVINVAPGCLMNTSMGDVDNNLGDSGYVPGGGRPIGGNSNESRG